MELLARTCHTERMNVERLIARIFVALGGIFWVAAVFGANFRYSDQSLVESVGTALLPLGIAVVALAVGWFYETLAAVLLGVGAVGVVVWGIVVGWEAAVWLIMAAVLIAPMIIAAVLFSLAARMQRICTLEGVEP